MKFINKLFALLLLCAATMAACTKQEGVYEYHPTPKPPKRTVETDPDDVKAFKLNYLGDTYNTQMVANLTPDVAVLEAQLKGQDRLLIHIPINELGYITSGKYILRNSQPVDGVLSPSRFEVSRYTLATGSITYPQSSDFDITFVMEIDTMNLETHTITGFLDTLEAVHKTDPTKNFMLTKGEFSLQWNYFRFEIDGVLQGEYPLTQNFVVTQSPTGGLAGGAFLIPNSNSSQINYVWRASFWTDENINHFNANKGVGEYSMGFTDIFDPTISTAATYIDRTVSPLKAYCPSVIMKVVLNNFYTDQFATGSIEFRGRETTTTNPRVFVPNAPERHYKVSFAYRQIL